MGKFQGPPKKNRFEGPPEDMSIEEGPMEKIPNTGKFQGPEDTNPIDLSQVPGAAESNAVLKEYNDSPEYMKALQSIDDLVRLFGTGATYGGSDTLGGDESRKLTENARTRAGSAGMVSELAGGFASPATRAIGAGAKALAPAGRGIMNWLGKALVTAGEGATIGGAGAFARGSPEDAWRDAAWGAALPLGIKAGSKVVTEPTKRLSSWLANKSHKDYSMAYKAGHTGNADISNAFREGIKRVAQTSTGQAADDAYKAGRALFRGSPSQRAVMSALNSITPSGAGAYMYNPLAAGLPALILAAGSPRAGGEISHAIGTVMGGLDMLASRGAVPALAYEQLERNKKRKEKK